MDREFVSYNIAVRLKELGFNDECFGSYYLDKDENHQEGKFDYRGELNIEYSIYKENTYYILAPIYQQAFSFLIPLQDEFKVCLDENGWYIYNLEGQTYSSNALEKLLSTVELNLIVKPDIDIVIENKSDYFEYFIYQLLTKYNKTEDNNFSRVKTLLLLTFLVHTDSGRDESNKLIKILFNNIGARPHGAYDFNISKIMNENKLKYLDISTSKTTIAKTPDFSDLNVELKTIIDKSIEKLLNYNPEILDYSLNMLMEVNKDHRYWLRNYHQNREVWNFDKPIPIKEIIESEKYYKYNIFKLI